MKKLFKYFLIVVLSVAFLVVVAATYIKYFLPSVGAAPDVNIIINRGRLERGDYLVNSVAACMACHSKRSFEYYAGPVDTLMPGAGGRPFGHDMGFPGEIYPPNITPHNLGNWTDGEIYRALTSGVTNKGKALFPVMPWRNYAQMEKEDVFAIVAYIRKLSPVKSETPETKLDFPVSLMVNTMPAKAPESLMPNPDSTVKYGKYLVTIANCGACHSKGHSGKPDPDSLFSGGVEFRFPGSVTRSMNITPDNGTGIGLWSRQQFIQRFKVYQDISKSMKLSPGEFNTPMPWNNYTNMTEKDLGAIYDYLRTVKPIKNKVEKFSKM
jgi:hypothetical protein